VGQILSVKKMDQFKSAIDRGAVEAQEFAQVSPEMHEEFIL